MDDFLTEAERLAAFANLPPAQVNEFRTVVPRFIPPSLWDLSSSGGDSSGLESAWQIIQRKVQRGWSEGFSLDLSIELITDVHRYSQQDRYWSSVERMSNEEVANARVPDAEVWPFQRAVMFLSVNSWRARFCPRCGKRFVAEKQRSLYCGKDCSDIARKGRMKSWWLKHGDLRRKDSKKAKTLVKKG